MPGWEKNGIANQQANQILPLRDAWWRKTTKAVLTNSNNPTHEQLNREHHGSGKRRWDHVFHTKMNAAQGHAPWYDEAVNRDACRLPETDIIRCVMRREGQPTAPLPSGRFVMVETDGMPRH